MSDLPLVPVQVRLMGRTLSLRVRAGDEERLRAWATDLDARLNAFRSAFPTQPEIVAALTVALALAEEAHTLREAQNDQEAASERLANGLVALDLRLAAALHRTGEGG
jgi:cell division protein ZapA (FtsZ GTPase activity inhibitor)